MTKDYSFKATYGFNEIYRFKGIKVNPKGTFTIESEAGKVCLTHEEIRQIKEVADEHKANLKESLDGQTNINDFLE